MMPGGVGFAGNPLVAELHGVPIRGFWQGQMADFLEPLLSPDDLRMTLGWIIAG